MAKPDGQLCLGFLLTGLCYRGQIEGIALKVRQTTLSENKW